MTRNLMLAFTSAALLAVAPGSMARADAGFNKDFSNDTGAVANDFEILLAGNPPINVFYNGPFRNRPGTTFDPPSIMSLPGLTLIHWAGGDASIPPGGDAHVGIETSDPTLIVLGVYFTHDGNFIGCGHQLSERSDWERIVWGEVIIANTAVNCQAETLYVGNVTV